MCRLFQIREQMTIAEKEQAVIEDPVLIESEEEEEEEDEEIEELEEEEEEELVALTLEMEDEIDAALVPHPPDETLLEGFKLLITRHDIQTLNGLNWLNDEVWFFVGLGVYRYLCTWVGYVIHGRVPGSHVQSGFNFLFSIKVAL